MMKLLNKLFTRTVQPRCIWGGNHSGGPICFVEIGRECGHVERDVPACLAHVQMLLETGGVARRPAPCFIDDCDVVSIGRVVNTRDIPA